MFNYFDLLPEPVRTRVISRKDFPFSQQLFWDAALENIDNEKHKNYIIERVISRGGLEDFFYLLKMYQRSEIVDAVKKSKVLDAKTVNFCSLYFDIPLKELHASSFYAE
jgi:hypothetical protein